MATPEELECDYDLFSFLFGDDNVGGEATNPCWINVHEDEDAPQETTLVGGSEHKAGDVIVDQAGNQYQAVEDSEFVSARDAEELEDGSDIFMKPGCYTKAVLLPKVRKPRTRKALSPDLVALQLPADRKAKLVRGKIVIVEKKGKTVKTTQIVGARYGIGIIEHNADLEQIVNAIVDAGIEVDEESTLNNVFVAPENVVRAVEIINGLGYTTDEDAE